MTGERDAGVDGIDDAATVDDGTAEPAAYPRRGVLQGMGALGVGIGGGMGSPRQVVEGVRAALGQADPTEHDPHTVATWRAVVDAVVPRTPGLGEELGDEHAPGGLEIGLEIGLIEFLDGFISPEGTVPRVAPTGETAPLSAAVAAALDAAAAELVARGGTRDEPDPAVLDGGGTFAALSRRDRFRAMADMEERGGKYGGFVVALAAAFPAILYYSEWDGYDDFSNPPSERSFSGDVQSWEQTGYEGPTNGAAVLRGYELDEFEETYGEDDGNDDRPGNGPPDGRGGSDGPGEPDSSGGPDASDGSAGSDGPDGSGVTGGRDAPGDSGSWMGGDVV